MNVDTLEFDTEQIIIGLKPWVETESPSFDPEGVNKVVDLAAYDLASLGATVQRVPGRFGFADTLKATIAGRHDTQPGILIACHADTVHPVGSLATMPYRREGNRLWGAGIVSTKAGLHICLEALRQLVKAHWQPSLNVTFLLVPDREIACPTTREFIESCAKSNRFTLVPEHAVNGALVSGRRASARYQIDVKLDTVDQLKANAAPGTNSAISMLARHIIEIESSSVQDCTFRVGSIESGKWVNFAEKCTAEVVVEAGTQQAVVEGARRMLALNSPNPDFGLHVNSGASLPLWQPDGSSQELVSVAQSVAGSLGLDLQATVGADSSLANITAAAGSATLDGLGVCGNGARTRAEYIEIDSLVERSKLIAGLLVALQ